MRRSDSAPELRPRPATLTDGNAPTASPEINAAAGAATPEPGIVELDADDAMAGATAPEVGDNPIAEEAHAPSDNDASDDEEHADDAAAPSAPSAAEADPTEQPNDPTPQSLWQRRFDNLRDNNGVKGNQARLVREATHSRYNIDPEIDGPAEALTKIKRLTADVAQSLAQIEKSLKARTEAEDTFLLDAGTDNALQLTALERLSQANSTDGVSHYKHLQFYQAPNSNPEKTKLESIINNVKVELSETIQPAQKTQIAADVKALAKLQMRIQLAKHITTTLSEQRALLVRTKPFNALHNDRHKNYKEAIIKHDIDRIDAAMADLNAFIGKPKQSAEAPAKEKPATGAYAIYDKKVAELNVYDTQPGNSADQVISNVLTTGDTQLQLTHYADKFAMNFLRTGASVSYQAPKTNTQSQLLGALETYRGMHNELKKIVTRANKVVDDFKDTDTLPLESFIDAIDYIDVNSTENPEGDNKRHSYQEILQHLDKIQSVQDSLGKSYEAHLHALLEHTDLGNFDLNQNQLDPKTPQDLITLHQQLTQKIKACQAAHDALTEKLIAAHDAPVIDSDARFWEVKSLEQNLKSTHKALDTLLNTKHRQTQLDLLSGYDNSHLTEMLKTKFVSRSKMLGQDFQHHADQWALKHWDKAGLFSAITMPLDLILYRPMLAIKHFFGERSKRAHGVSELTAKDLQYHPEYKERLAMRTVTFNCIDRSFDGSKRGSDGNITEGLYVDVAKGNGESSHEAVRLAVFGSFNSETKTFEKGYYELAKAFFSGEGRQGVQGMSERETAERVKLIKTKQADGSYKLGVEVICKGAGSTWGDQYFQKKSQGNETKFTTMEFHRFIKTEYKKMREAQEKQKHEVEVTTKDRVPANEADKENQTGNKDDQAQQTKLTRPLFAATERTQQDNAWKTGTPSCLSQAGNNATPEDEASEQENRTSVTP